MDVLQRVLKKGAVQPWRSQRKPLVTSTNLNLLGDQNMVPDESGTQFRSLGGHTGKKSTPKLLSHMPNSPLGRIGRKVLIQKCGILFNKFLRIV